jgi:hypothetical protein
MAEKRYPMNEAEPWHDYYVIRKYKAGWRYVYYWNYDGLGYEAGDGVWETKAEALHDAADNAHEWEDYGGGPVSERLREAARLAARGEGGAE